MNHRTMLKSKLHRATVTDANLDYEGSISIDRRLLEPADLLPFEQVDIYNCNNGERFTTYVIEGGPGEITINGAAARKAAPGDQVIIASYISVPDEKCYSHKPKLIFVDKKNAIVHEKKAITA
ncbi:MAG: aspartate 1-decarboxylase [Chthoniobacterales bacterium]